MSQHAKTYFRSIAAALGDDEPGRPFQRYTLHDMVMAYNRGLAIVYKYRPDLFTGIQKVHLQEGSRQNAQGCCDNILAVLEQVDADGNIIKEITTSKAESGKAALQSWSAKPSCLIRTDATGAEVAYSIDYATIDPSMNGRFNVYPPVPCGVDAWVNVKCVSPPCEMHEENINGSLPGSSLHATALWHYVISCMFIGDRHAAGATAEAAQNFSIFLQLLGIEMKQEMMFESEGAANVVRQIK